MLSGVYNRIKHILGIHLANFVTSEDMWDKTQAHSSSWPAWGCQPSSPMEDTLAFMFQQCHFIRLTGSHLTQWWIVVLYAQARQCERLGWILREFKKVKSALCGHWFYLHRVQEVIFIQDILYNCVSLGAVLLLEKILNHIGGSGAFLLLGDFIDIFSLHLQLIV